MDEAEGVAAARIQAGSSSADVTTGALRGIQALDSAAYRQSFPRVAVVVFEDDAEHFTPADRERMVRANCAVRHRTVRLLIARSALHAATLSVMKQLVDEKSMSRWTTARSLDAGLAVIGRERPGIDRVVRRLFAVLDESMQSTVLKSARPASWPAQSRRQVP